MPDRNPLPPTLPCRFCGSGASDLDKSRVHGGWYLQCLDCGTIILLPVEATASREEALQAVTRDAPLADQAARIAQLETARETAADQIERLPREWREACAKVEAQRGEITRLRAALESAANALDAVAERTWDKRHPDECKRACADASDMAAGAREEAQEALKQ